MTKKHRRGGVRSTKRMREAKAALVEAATELACVVGTAHPISIRENVGHEVAEAIAAVYRANDEWQEAQLRGESFTHVAMTPAVRFNTRIVRNRRKR